jgi:hypothetical protein
MRHVDFVFAHDGATNRTVCLLFGQDKPDRCTLKEMRNACLPGSFEHAAV